MNEKASGWPWITASAWGGVSILLAWFLRRHWHVGPIDDAFISLRYAANWATGRGLAFNPGERVEGYTNFLLVLLQAIGIRLGLDPEVVLGAFGWIFIGSTAAVVARFCSAYVFKGRQLLALTTAVLVTVNPAFLGWSISGLQPRPSG